MRLQSLWILCSSCLSNVFSCLSTLVCVFTRTCHCWPVSVSVSDLCECYLAVVHPVIFLKYKPLRYRVICCTVAWIIVLDHVCFLGLSYTLSIWRHTAGFFNTVLFLPLHPVVLSCGCSQSSEAVRTRREKERERGRKPHEEKSV